MRYLRHIILVAILAASTPSFAQLTALSAGVRTGSNIGSISLQNRIYDGYSSSPSVFALGGFWLQYRTQSGISVRPEIIYKGRGGILTCNDVYYRLATNTIDIRLNMQLDFYVARSFASFYLVAAPSYVHTLGGHVDYRDDICGELELNLSSSNISDNEFEIFCGAGFEYPIFSMLFSLEAGYSFSLTNTFTDAERNGELNVLNLANISQPSTGSRLLRGFEVAVRVGIPLGHHMKIKR